MHATQIILATVELFYLFTLCESQSTEFVQARLVTEYRANYSECGVHPNDIGRRTVLKIIGGATTSVSLWPWYVQIFSINNRTGVRRERCAGALLNRRYVLTVASCVSGVNHRLGVILGRGPRYSVNVHQKRIRVQRILTHPGYKNGFFENDVAVLQLVKPVNFTEFVRPVCIPEYDTDIANAESNDSLVGQTCTVLGWGVTRENEIDSIPNNLQQLSVPIYSDEQCHNATRGFFRPGGTLFCAGGLNGRGTCDGDGGGPLLCLHPDENKFYVHGLVSSGFGCGIPNLPDFYTDVGHRLINGWIRGLIS